LLIPQLFKGAFYYCEGPDIKNVRNRTDCEADSRNVWINRKYNFDDLGKALMSLFVLSSRDGWVNIMYTGLDAVGVNQQVSTHSTIIKPFTWYYFLDILPLYIYLMLKPLQYCHEWYLGTTNWMLKFLKQIVFEEYNGLYT
jgi:hypothetical protein